jgi:hypothetical protein
MRDAVHTEEADPAALKRHAMALFLQLPKDLAEAEEILGYMREILKWHQGHPYCWVEGEPTHGPGEVVPFMRRG